MTGIVALIVKVMPESPETDLESIKQGVQKAMEKEGAQNISFTEQNIAFGLKAVMLKMAWPEEKSTDIVVNNIQEVSGVSSVNIEDYRRAFG